MTQCWEGKTAMRVVVTSLYVLLICSLVEAALTLRLFVSHYVDGTTSISLILTFTTVSPEQIQLDWRAADHVLVDSYAFLPLNSFLLRASV